MKKVLIIGATHGNEPLGIEVAARLRTQGLGNSFDLLIANPKALEQGVRLTDADLNRSYPGDATSSKYEVVRAAENLKQAKQYAYCLDIHEASAGTDDFIISPREALDTTFPIEMIDLNRVILWPEPKGPLGGVLMNTVEIEFGTRGRDRAELVTTATDIIERCVRSIAQGTGQATGLKQIYKVTGTIALDDKRYKDSLLQDFQKVDDVTPWFPLLTGQYTRLGIRCYRMEKVDNP